MNSFPGSITERIANLRIEYILATCAVLLVARLILGKLVSSGKLNTPIGKGATEFVESALIAIVLVFLIIRPFIVQAFYIPSESMLPTLQVSDHILVNKFIYRFREPQHGDIIVFKSPPQANEARARYGTYGPVEMVGDDRDRCLVDWNQVVGEITSLDTQTGEAVISPEGNYGGHFGDFKKLCVASSDSCEVMDVGSVRNDGRSVIVKLMGITSAEAAEKFKGAQVRIGETDYIKRVIGLPGDVIDVKPIGTDDIGRPRSAVFRNGVRLTEPYIYAPPDYTLDLNGHPGPVKVPEGKLWVMGDNRPDSNDSHEWGFLDRDRVVGKAMFTFWPLNRIGVIH